MAMAWSSTSSKVIANPPPPQRRAGTVVPFVTLIAQMTGKGKPEVQRPHGGRGHETAMAATHGGVRHLARGNRLLDERDLLSPAHGLAASRPAWGAGRRRTAHLEPHPRARRAHLQ